MSIDWFVWHFKPTHTVYFKQKSYSFKSTSASEIIVLSLGAKSDISGEDKVYFREQWPRKVNTLVCWLVILYAVIRKCLDIVLKRGTKKKKNQYKFKCFKKQHLISRSKVLSTSLTSFKTAFLFTNFQFDLSQDSLHKDKYREQW